MASVNRVDLGEATLTGRLPIGAGQPRVVSWLPNETLFSLASRHHHIAGNSTPDQTCLQLFGDKRIGCSHDFPAGLRHFVAQTEGILGSSTGITIQHSILPFYLAFHPEFRCSKWLTNIADGSICTMKAELGILASRFGASHPLKACALCMCEDSRLHHVAYWHVQHQLPGVWVCPVHRCALQIATMKWRGHNRFGWLLPTQTEWVVPQAEPNTEHLPAFLAMASGAIEKSRLNWCHGVRFIEPVQLSSN